MPQKITFCNKKAAILILLPIDLKYNFRVLGVWRTILEIVRCPGNTRTILEFCGQLKKKSKFQILADNFKICRTISEFGGQF
jgi:hypothetical protein